MSTKLFGAVLLLSVSLLVLLFKSSSEDKKKDLSYLWSKRVFTVNHYNVSGTEIRADKNTIRKQVKSAKDVLWIRNSSHNKNVSTDLDLVPDFLDLIEESVILVTSDGDRPVPSSYSDDVVGKILSSPKIKKWYTQNYDKSVIHPKLGFYPIGLDMNTKARVGGSMFDVFKSPLEVRLRKLNYYLDVREKYKNSKKNKIFCDSHLSITHPRRKEMYEVLKHNKFVVFQESRVPYKGIINKYAQHRFVLSPRGAGLDCHRTWEAFLLGSIVITESSSLDEMYIKNDLPVVIVKNFNELNDVTEDQLEVWYNQHKSKTYKNVILTKFKPEYWIKELMQNKK